MSFVSAWRSMGTIQPYKPPASLPGTSYAICMHGCLEPPMPPASCHRDNDMRSLIAQVLLQLTVYALYLILSMTSALQLVNKHGHLPDKNHGVPASFCGHASQLV